jgi:glycopeptide antibiotics resistance protein
MSKRVLIIWTTLVFGLIAAMPNGFALAYLDPGSGSLIIQLVIAGLLGLAVAGRLFWTNILVFLKIKQHDVDVDEIDEDDE